jgi:muramoyltetrapeptide carboxypeptidase
LLKRNAKIAVVSPAGIPVLEGLAAGEKLARSFGYEVVRGPHAGDKHHYNAGTVEARTADLRWALEDPGIDAVWLSRGGYGSVHCLPSITAERLDGRPLIGCSDATALFSAFGKTRGGALVHGPMLETIATKLDDASRERMRALLAGEPLAPIPAEHFCGPRVEASGPVVGGNLCVLASLAGTPWALAARDAILVLEDVTELPYRIDRLITQLRYSGALDGVRAIALGDFVKCDPPEGADYTLADVLEDALGPLGVPVYWRLPLGHDKRNLAFRIGAPGTIGPAGLVQ